MGGGVLVSLDGVPEDEVHVFSKGVGRANARGGALNVAGPATSPPSVSRHKSVASVAASLGIGLPSVLRTEQLWCRLSLRRAVRFATLCLIY